MAISVTHIGLVHITCRCRSHCGTAGEVIPSRRPLLSLMPPSHPPAVSRHSFLQRQKWLGRPNVSAGLSSQGAPLSPALDPGCRHGHRKIYRIPSRHEVGSPLSRADRLMKPPQAPLIPSWVWLAGWQADRQNDKPRDVAWCGRAAA